ncbi:hypothetical protein LEMLEM_LOCUS1272 [Lemmus lemmus]
MPSENTDPHNGRRKQKRDICTIMALLRTHQTTEVTKQPILNSKAGMPKRRDSNIILSLAVNRMESWLPYRCWTQVGSLSTMRTAGAGPRSVLSLP